LKFKDKEHKLGHVSEDLINTLKDMNKYAVIVAKLEEKSNPICLPDFPGLVFGKSGDNTTITVSSNTEENLNIKANNLIQYLEKEGIITSERCRWVCSLDKAKEKVIETKLSEKEKSVRELGMKLMNKHE